ncbi:uncharacterized protein ACOB7L_017490 [Callospermophilus lateralis]
MPPTTTAPSPGVDASILGHCCCHHHHLKIHQPLSWDTCKGLEAQCRAACRFYSPTPWDMDASFWGQKPGPGAPRGAGWGRGPRATAPAWWEFSGSSRHLTACAGTASDLHRRCVLPLVNVEAEFDRAGFPQQAVDGCGGNPQQGVYHLEPAAASAASRRRRRLPPVNIEAEFQCAGFPQQVVDACGGNPQQGVHHLEPAAASAASRRRRRLPPVNIEAEFQCAGFPQQVVDACGGNPQQGVHHLEPDGFRKVVQIIDSGIVKQERDGPVEFQHPYFKQGQDDLLENIKRKVH